MKNDWCFGYKKLVTTPGVCHWQKLKTFHVRIRNDQGTERLLGSVTVF